MIWILLAAVIATAAVFIMWRTARTEQTPDTRVPSDSVATPGELLYIEVRLFADDVSLKKGLPLSLSVETFGGVSTMLILRGTGLPKAQRETFSTITDNQPSIGVHVLVGDHTLAADNVTVGNFSVVEIPPAPRGVPKFAVELALDDQGVFRFSAKDLASGKSQPVSGAGTLSNPLAQTRVETMLDEARAEEAKGEYGIPRTTPDDRDSVNVSTKKLRDLVESTRVMLKSGSAIPETARKQCEEQLKNAERVLEANARPERASVKLNALKADELEDVLRSLGKAAKQCR